MRSFDLEAAMRGEKVYTNTGAKVVDLQFNEETGIIKAMLRNITIEDYPAYFDKNGYSINPCGPTQLIMADDAPEETKEAAPATSEEAEKVDWTYWRHMFASMAMQIYLQNETPLPSHEIAQMAVEHADALIEELKK